MCSSGSRKGVDISVVDVLEELLFWTTKDTLTFVFFAMI